MTLPPKLISRLHSSIDEKDDPIDLSHPTKPIYESLFLISSKLCALF